MTILEQAEQIEERLAVKNAALVDEPGYVESLLLQMQSESIILRVAAANHLTFLGTTAAKPEMIEALKQLLSDQDNGVRKAAITTLGAFGTRTTEYPGLLSMLALQFHRDSADLTAASIMALNKIPWTYAKGEDYNSIRDALLHVASSDTLPETLRRRLDDALLMYRLQETPIINSPDFWDNLVKVAKRILVQRRLTTASTGKAGGLEDEGIIAEYEDNERGLTVLIERENNELTLAVILRASPIDQIQEGETVIRQIAIQPPGHDEDVAVIPVSLRRYGDNLEGSHLLSPDEIEELARGILFMD